MTTLRQAAQQALHELEGIPFYRKYGVRISNAITALREALAQPEQEPVEQYAKLAQHCAMLEHKLALTEQEHALHKLARLSQEIEQGPVAWRDPTNIDPGHCTYTKEKHEKWPHIYRQALYTAPPAAQPEQEVSCRFCHDKGGCWAWQCYHCGEIDDVQQPTPAAAQLEPTPWRDMIVATLVREGINKHRARELADHFAAQRPWQGLTPEEVKRLYPYGRSVWGKETFEAIEKALKERNT